MERQEIVQQFDIKGKIVSIEPVGNGWINDTYRVKTEGSAPDYILQRINHYVFRDVELMQRNIDLITTHIRKKLVEAGETDIDRKVLTIVPTKNGGLYYYNGTDYWRMMIFIAGSKTYETMTPELAKLTGEKFGEFQAMLADLPEGSLGESIPDFHNIEFRLEQFQEAIEKDSEERLAVSRELVDELLQRADEMCLAQQLYREGKLPKRSTHCDTKVNNLLFDENDKPLCVIDLDTTMPGFVLSDFGDFIRTGANTGAEDDPNLDQIDVDMDIIRAFTKGYIRTAGGFLTPLERELLPFGAKMLTYMQTVRFLTDYLNGDVYYKIKSPEHNLQRSHAQFKLLRGIEQKEQAMKDYIAGL